jgi:aspartyl protease family protein
MRQLLVFAIIASLAADAFAGSAEIDRGADGHWRTEARVNGRKIEVLVDTGATVVALTRDDAEAAGIDVRKLRFDARVRTASGTTRAADVTLEQVHIGNVRLRDVEAVVVERGLPVSLLGMSFLSRLEQFHVRGQTLRLRD